MKDHVFLRDLRVKAVIGIFEWERRVTQTVAIDLDMAVDVAKAAASDSIDDTLNYKAVAKRVAAYVEESRFNLVETLAERIAEVVRTEFGVTWVRVRVNKPGAISRARDVGVVIERGAHDG
jgi:dihydroneopterin aldolase